MKIILSGVETRNKGAELMLYAILQEIERKYPNATVYVEPDSIPQGVGYIKTTLKLKDKPVAYARRLARRLRLFSVLKLLKISWLPLEDIYAMRDADYYLNDSGYSITDKWNITEYELRIRELTYSKQSKQRTKMVFLPQAFGPIEKENTKLNVCLLNKFADLVMARDRISYNYLKESGLIDMKKVQIHPDFTSLVKGSFPVSHDGLKGGVCIIPNVRMLDMDTLSYNQYKAFIHEIVLIAKDNGKKAYLLNHEGEEDRNLAKRFQRDINDDLYVVDGLDALEIKGLIATAYLVISSRFHGVVSSLNSCVPCLATSWSHKYEELYRDYHQDGCVLDPRDIDTVTQKVRQYINPKKNASVREHLSLILPKMQRQAEQMWEHVWS